MKRGRPVHLEVPKRARAKEPALSQTPPNLSTSFEVASIGEDMAQIDMLENGTHAFDPDAILGAFTNGDNGVISDFVYEVQNSSDAFKYASSPEKRDRLLHEFLKRNDWLFVAALACDELFRTVLFDHLEQTFPKNISMFQGSLAERTIKSLESFLSQFTASEFKDVLQEHQRVFLKISRALTGLNAMVISPPPSPVKEKGESGPGHRRKMSQQELKRARVKQPSMDETPFQILGIRTPESLQEYETTIESIMATLKNILGDHIINMGQPEVFSYCIGIITSSTQLATPSEDRETCLDTQTSPLVSVVEGSTFLHPINSTSPSQYFDDDVEGFGQWKILLSTRCAGDLRKFKRASAKRFDIIQKKIRELSKGFFSDDNQKKLTGPKTEIPVFEAKMEGDTRLVYTVDCAVDETGQTEIQVLKLFGVYTHKQLEHGGLWDAVGQHLQRRGAAHRKRCLARQTSRECDDYYVPLSFSPLPEVYEEVTTPTGLDQSQLLKLHSILALEKFIPFTQTVLNSILADEDATHRFSVSYREQEIILHKSSCFVLGRSGTGKTTTMLFKMFGTEQSNASQKPRQVFITQSQVLAERVQEYYIKLAQSLASGRKRQEETINNTHSTEVERELLGPDGEDHSQSRLPKKFSELTDNHFPLFVTFDQLCVLLEADLDLSFKRKAPTNEQRRALRRFELRYLKDVSLNLEDEPTENEQENREQPGIEEESKIDYYAFRSGYWPHFPQHLTKGLDPALVWSEFLGVICGSEASLGTPNGCMDRESYQNLSRRTQATFASRRSVVYDLFQIYVKQKRESRAYDVADRTHAILHAIQTSGVPGPRFDHLYCDESQDNLLIDIKLIHMLCKNPHGFFWAGDTAQQITSTAFRFADLKAFLFRLEEADQLVKLGKRKAVHPRSFSLSINYRSHGGIVNCAQTVIDAITHLWPDSIDVLERERGVVDGPRPIYFRNESDNVAHYEQFLFGEAGSRVEFGAEQCILVRNDAAREELRTTIGDIGLIMTLYEAKGLEFSDVLLYNFFTDSPASKTDWRVINNVDGEKRAGIAAPSFNELRHASICSELKFLYVGLTRARNQLWIWDSSDIGEPMCTLWDSRKQIDVRKQGDPIPKLAASSTREEWAKTGRHLFSHNRYRQAELCFDRAGLTLDRNISHAFVLREEARLLERRSRQRQLTFETAAEAFWECAEMGQDQRTRCFIHSAECYIEANRLRRASDAYSYAKEWTLAARYARMAGEFDRALEIIKESQGVEEKVADSIINVCKIVFARTEQVEKARALCKSDEDLLGLMDDCNLEKTPILEDLGRYIEAGELRAAAGDTVDAIRLFILGDDQDLAAQCLCDAFWEQMPFGMTMTDLNAERVRALKEVSAEINATTPQLKNELDMFRALLDGDEAALGILSEIFSDSGGARQEAAALRCLDYLSRQEPAIDSMSFEEMDQLQSCLSLFGTRFRKLSRGQNLHTWASVQRLFGFNLEDTGLEATVFPTSCIPSLASQELSMKGSDEKGSLVVNAQELGFWIAQFVTQRLVSVLYNYGASCLRSKPFSSFCYAYLEGWKQDCQCYRLHCHKEEVPQFYNKQVHLYLKQLHVLSQGEPWNLEDKVAQRNHYLRRIFEILFPVHDATGNLDTFTLDSGLSEGVIVLRQWVQDRTVHLNVKNTTAMLRMLIMASTLDIYRTPDLRRGKTIRRLPTDHTGYRGPQPLLLDLINSLFKLAEGGIVQGIGFLRHIITERVSIDAHVLVVYLEILTAIILRCLRPSNADGVILPRSFLIQFVQRRQPPRFDSRELEPLFSPLQQLVESIHLGYGPLRVEGYPLDKAPTVFRSLLISRIFRCLVLIGCNSGDSKVQERIGISITALGRNRDGRELPYFYSRYVQAQQWEHLATAVYESFDGSAVDQMVRLVRTSKPYSHQIHKGPASLQFRNEAELCATFTSSPLLIIKKSTLRPAAQPFIPASVRRTEPRSHTSEVTSIIDLDSKGAGTTTSLLSVEDMKAPIPREEIRAALVIQAAYRKACRRTALKETDEVFKKWYGQCAEVRNMLSGPRFYQMYLLGPLPHVLVWADAAVRCLKSRRDSVRAKFKDTRHTEIEELSDHLNACTDDYKRAVQLQKRLLPKSEVHRQCQLPELKKLVSRLDEMTLELELGLGGVEEHRYLGRKGIVQERSTVTEAGPLVSTPSTGDIRTI